jgi:hypothetical protein
MSVEHRVSEDLHAFADITVTEGDIMHAHQQLQQRIATAVQHRNRARLVAAAAAVAVVVAGTWWFSQSESQSGLPPVNEPTQLVPEPQAQSIATTFVEAYAAFDVPRARSVLADDGASFALGADWRQFNAFLEASGASLLLEPCVPIDTTVAGTTMRCSFAYHALRSGELGRGPFTGSSFDLTVAEDRIVAASMNFEFASNGFSSRMWEPFAAWVSETHPKDAAIMYADWPDSSEQRMTPAALDLWSENTRAYVDQVLANRASAAADGPG